MKELQEFAVANNYDCARVKQQNQQLVGEGLVKERKKPIAHFQVSGENLVAKIEKLKG